MRTIIIALLTALTLISAKPQRLAAANPAGDADNDGSVTLADAALIQAVLYGTVTTQNISPLALTGADTAFSLDDLLLTAQAAGLVRTGLTPPTGILSISVPPVPLVVASEQLPNPVIGFAVVSAYPGAGDINGLQVGSFSILEAVESTLTNPDAFVTTNLANVELLPLNTTGTDDQLTVRLEVPIHDSDGGLVETLSGDFPVTVTAAVCGDGVIQSGETCDDGDTDPCTATCNATCTGPATNTCGDGTVNCGEACDVPLPHNPTFVGSYNTPGYAYDVFVIGTRAYVADDISGLQVLDITTPTPPTLVGAYDTPSFAYGVFVSGNRAYVADDISGLQVLDFSTPTPTFVGSYDTPGYAQGVFISGTRAYIADGDSLQVLDISAPIPTFVGAYDTPGNARDVFVSGDRAYVADGGSGLQVLDISTPTPTFVGAYDTPDSALGAFVSGNRAFVADYDSGLQVLDITTPTPTLVGAYDTPGRAYGVFVSGTRAYVADDLSGLQVLDISTDTPTFVGAYDTPGFAYGVFVSGTRAYVADYSSGLQVLDISEPCTQSCKLDVCGDGVVTTGESCDDGNTLSDDGCRGDCLLVEYCGNGAIETGEACDDGDLDPCTAACNAHCSGPAANICGDGLIECGEACDDGDLDPCTPACNAYCTAPAANACGDSRVECGEACDDGDTDDCTPTCNATCTGPVPLVCGDGVKECAEVCDDGNTLDCDGCRGDCAMIEFGCGDGAICGTETCDYGAGAPPADGCTAPQICAADCSTCVLNPPPTTGVGGGALLGTMTVCAVDSRTLAAIPEVEVLAGDTYTANLHCTTDPTGCCTITDPALVAPAGGIDVTFARVGYPYTTFSRINVDTVVARLDMLPGRRALDTGQATAGDNTALVAGQFDTTTLDLIHPYRERHGPPVPSPARAALVFEALRNPDVADLDLASLLAPSIPKQVTVGSITTEMRVPAGMVIPDYVSTDGARWQTALTGAGPHLLVALGVSINIESIDLYRLVSGFSDGNILFDAFSLVVVEADLARIDIAPADLSATGFVDADTLIGRQLALGTIDFGSSWSDNQYWRIWEGGSLFFSNRHRMIVSDTQGAQVPNTTVRNLLADLVLSGWMTQPFLTSATAIDPDTAYMNRCRSPLDGRWWICLFNLSTASETPGEHQGFLFREGDGRGAQQEGLWLAGYQLAGGDFDGQLVPYGIANRAFVECGGANAIGNTCNASVSFGEPTSTGEASILSITGASGVTRQSVAAHYKPEPRGTGIWDRDQSNHDLANGYRLGLDIDDVALALPYGINPADPGAGIDASEFYLCGTDQEDACCATGTCSYEAWDIDLRTLTFGTTAYPRKADHYQHVLSLDTFAVDHMDMLIADPRKAGECIVSRVSCTSDLDCGQAGWCSVSTGTACRRDRDCPLGETCGKSCENEPSTPCQDYGDCPSSPSPRNCIEADACDIYLPVGDIWTIYSATEGVVNLPDISGLPQGPGDGRIGTYDDRHIFGDASLGATNPGINSTGNWTPQVDWTILGRGGEGMPSTYTWNNWSFSDLDGAESFSINKQEMNWEGN